MKIESVFKNNEKIPEKYTCDGENISPFLKISEIPENTQSLALIIDDPDAPGKVWVHWVVFNIPVFSNSSEIKEGEKPKGSVEGFNDFGLINYKGPSPPSGVHRYFFKIYALNDKLNLINATKEKLIKAMEGHILGKAELIGIYSRK